MLVPSLTLTVLADPDHAVRSGRGGWVGRLERRP